MSEEEKAESCTTHYKVRYAHFGESEWIEQFFDFEHMDKAIENYKYTLSLPKVERAKVVEIRRIETVVLSGVKKQFIDEVKHDY